MFFNKYGYIFRCGLACVAPTQGDAGLISKYCSDDNALHCQLWDKCATAGNSSEQGSLVLSEVSQAAKRQASAANLHPFTTAGCSGLMDSQQGVPHSAPSVPDRWIVSSSWKDSQRYSHSITRLLQFGGSVHKLWLSVFGGTWCALCSLQCCCCCCILLPSRV